MRTIDSVYIELTSNCNLRCKHCYNCSGDENYEQSIISLENLAKELRKYNCNMISFSGGEPLLYKELERAIGIFKDNHKIRLVSNGTLINEENVENLCSHIDEFQLSIDGTSEAENDYIRGQGAFKNVLKGLSCLSGKAKKIIVHTVIINNTVSHINNFIDLLEEYNVQEVDFQLLNNVGRAKNNSLISDYTFEQYSNLCTIIENKSKDKDIKIVKPQITYGKCPLLSDNTSLNLKIDFKGDVYLCQRFDMDSLFSIGNINHQSLESMLISENYRDLIQLMECAPKHIRKCKDCNHEVICSKPCPADIINEGIFNYKDIFCQSRLSSLF